MTDTFELDITPATPRSPLTDWPKRAELNRSAIQSGIFEAGVAKTGKMERQLQHWGSRLEEIVARIEHVGSLATADYRKRIYDLRSQHALVQSKIHDVKAAGTMAYRGVSAELDSSWKELLDGFKRMKS